MFVIKQTIELPPKNIFITNIFEAKTSINFPKIKKENDNVLLFCPHCAYKTNKTFNFDRHIKTHKSKKIFAINKTYKFKMNDKSNFISDSNNFIFNNNKIEPSKKNNKQKINKDINTEKNVLDLSKKNNYVDSLEYFRILKHLFLPNDHLNSQELDFQNYYVYDNHVLGHGSFGNIFLGSDKKTGIRVAIKQIEESLYFSYKREKMILTNIRGTGNFPEFYDSIEMPKHLYIIESLNGPTIQTLIKICGGNFDLRTTLNIGLDLISNIEILHNLGFYHRDLKPNNIYFGSLARGGAKYKNCVGILDFGNGDIINQNGKIANKNNFGNYGNKYYSSDNVLKGGSFNIYDDIISIFYILIEVFVGQLPWKKKILDSKSISCEEIIEIRKKTTVEELCKNFPNSFCDLFSLILNNKINDIPPYKIIKETLNELCKKLDEIEGKKKYRFKWLFLFEEYKTNQKNNLNSASFNEMKNFIKTYGLIFDNYFYFLNKEIID